MEEPELRKPRLYFETMPHPHHVTFNDGETCKWNFPWAHYVWTRLDFAERDALKLIFGDWLVIIQGRQLEPLYAAVADRTLYYVGVHPAFADDREHEADTFVTEIGFLRVPSTPEQNGQLKFKFGRR
jgi:hypothetical protein